MKKKGFTLIEILISITIISFSIFLIYKSYFTISQNTKDLEEKLKKKEIILNFLIEFKKSIENIRDFENLKMDKKELSLTTFLPNVEFPVILTYKVENKNTYEILIREQKNFINGYKFYFPIFKAKSINFSYLNNDKWDYNPDKNNLNSIAIEIELEDDYIFYPVNIYREKKEKNEKK